LYTACVCRGVLRFFNKIALLLIKKKCLREALMLRYPHSEDPRGYRPQGFFPDQFGG